MNWWKKKNARLAILTLLFFPTRSFMKPILTSGYKADRQNSPNGKHYLWLSSPFQRLGSVYCRLHSSPLYQRAWKTEKQQQRLTHLLFTLMQWNGRQNTTARKKGMGGKERGKILIRWRQSTNLPWQACGIFVNERDKHASQLSANDLIKMITWF